MKTRQKLSSKSKKIDQKLSLKREKVQPNFSSQYWRKFERYFLAKSEKAVIKKQRGDTPHPPPARAAAGCNIAISIRFK
jgi:hypothetical protein